MALRPLEPKSSASASSATFAIFLNLTGSWTAGDWFYGIVPIHN